VCGVYGLLGGIELANGTSFDFLEIGDTLTVLWTTQKTRNFIVAFFVIWVATFIDVHFLAFFPLTIREPLSVGMSAIVATLVGLLAGLHTLTRGGD
jgi:hypothetical protein